MDRLQLAQHRFWQIAPSLGGVDEQKSDQIEDWLRESVVPVVEDLLQNPRFRRYATYGLKNLTRDSISRERALVQTVDDGLVDCASVVVRVARETGHEGLLAEAYSSTADSGGDSNPLEEQFLPDGPSVIEMIARRPWFAMGIEDDYFTPQWHLFLQTSDAFLTEAFRRFYSNPKLLGDGVTQLLFARINFWAQQVDSAWQRVFQRLSQSSSAPCAALEELFATKMRLDECMLNLREACLTGSELRLRDAACTLTQAYVAYHPCAQLPWLDAASGNLVPIAGTLRSFFRHNGNVIEVRQSGRRYREVARRQARLVDMSLVQQVAAALDDVEHIYRQGIMPEDLIEEARQTYRLVVVERPRMVFWDGARLEVDWNGHEKSWELLLKLAIGAQHQQNVDRCEFAGSPSNRVLSTRKYHLTQLLMQSPDSAVLATKVDKIRGGGMCLKLDPNEVRVLDVRADDWTLDSEEFAEVPLE